MFTSRKDKNKAQLESFKVTIDECTGLKNEIMVLAEGNRALSTEDFLRITDVLDNYEKVKAEILLYKSNPILNSKNNLVAIKEKKDSINKIKTELISIKKTLEVY